MDNTVVDAVLSQLESLLEGGNYDVFLRIYRVPHLADATAEQYISAALGPSVGAGNTWSVSASEVVTEVENCLRHAGDEGYGPKPATLTSPRFNELVEGLSNYLMQSMADATEITAFRLHTGHPACPIFWNFAFVIEGTQQAEVFIGSSSD